MTQTTPAFHLRRDSYGRLVVTGQNGEEHAGVVPVRAFPIGAPDDGIALVNLEGHEVGWVGKAALILKGEEDIRRLSQTRLLIADTHGIHFLVRDIGMLDRHSRKLLDRFL